MSKTVDQRKPRKDGSMDSLGPNNVSSDYQLFTLCQTHEKTAHEYSSKISRKSQLCEKRLSPIKIMQSQNKKEFLNRMP